MPPKTVIPGLFRRLCAQLFLVTLAVTASLIGTEASQAQTNPIVYSSINAPGGFIQSGSTGSGVGYSVSADCTTFSNSVTTYYPDVVNANTAPTAFIPPLPPTITVSPSSFTLPTETAAGSGPFQPMTVTVGPTAPVGDYYSALGGDATTKSSPCYKNPNGPGGVYNGGHMFIEVDPIMTGAVRTSFTSFNLLGQPATALNVKNGWTGTGSDTEQAAMFAGYAGWGTQQQLLPCWGELTTKTLIKYPNCPQPVISPTTSAGTSALFTIDAPPNPTGSMETYNPGQLGIFTYGIWYGANGCCVAAGSSAVASAGTTIYDIADLKLWGFRGSTGENGTCSNFGVPGPILATLGSATPYNLPAPFGSQYFCIAFLEALLNNNSAVLDDPNYSADDNAIWQFDHNKPQRVVGVFTGGDLYPLHPEYGVANDTLHSVARDYAIIPPTPNTKSNPTPFYNVTLYNSGANGQSVSMVAQATDTGNAFKSQSHSITQNNNGYGWNHLDIFLGVATVRFPYLTLPMVLFGCDRAPPIVNNPNPKLAGQLVTLCPPVTGLATDQKPPPAATKREPSPIGRPSLEQSIMLKGLN